MTVEERTGHGCFLLEEVGGLLGTCKLCPPSPPPHFPDPVWWLRGSPCSPRPVLVSDSCSAGASVPLTLSLLATSKAFLAGFPVQMLCALPELMSCCLLVPSPSRWASFTWTGSLPPAPTAVPWATSGPDSRLISLPLLTPSPFGPDPAQWDPCRPAQLPESKSPEDEGAVCPPRLLPLQAGSTEGLESVQEPPGRRL